MISFNKRRLMARMDDRGARSLRGWGLVEVPVRDKAEDKNSNIAPLLVCIVDILV